MPSTPGTPLQAPAFNEGSLRKIVREMRVWGASYENAVREFLERYIVVVLIKHAFHLGSAAEDLGMHRNTLTRIIRKLGIEPKQIRRAMRAGSTDQTHVGGYFHSVWRRSDDSVKWKNESEERVPLSERGPAPEPGARSEPGDVHLR